MKIVFSSIPVLLSIILLAGCTEKIDMEKEKALIMELIQANDSALFKQDVDMMLSITTRESYNIIGAMIIKSTHDDMRKGFKRQFTNGRYIKIKHLIKPIITISDDATLASIICRVEYTYTKIDSDEPQFRKSVDAFMQIAVKKNNKWLLSDIAQTYGKLK